MSWFRESKRTWLESFCIRTLKAGPVPNHVAFIMDGNRRYANKLSLEKLQGHVHGFDKLTETLDWCLDLGIIEVTVYAFSTENFKRSKEEVDGLMHLAKEKFQHLLEEKEKLDKYGVQIRIMGDLSRLSADIQKLVAEVMLYTQNNDRLYLNVCLAYTSREEMCNAVKHMAEGVESGLILPSDINEELMDQCLYAPNIRPPDLLIRTSGEVRLSDFLLWQSTYSILAFLRVLWPEFNIWHFFAAILFYQYNYPALKVIKESHHNEHFHMQEAENLRQAEIEYKMKNDIPSSTQIELSSTEILKYKENHKARIKKFLIHFKNNQNNLLHKMGMIQLSDSNDGL